MVSSSKILTVSYGTFSCTLEGFDDPFTTMKSIAEYFRDLAADDRYFGAEPPTPDVEMLHRIAEREIKRRVEARIAKDGVVLRQLQEADAAEIAGVSGLPTHVPSDEDTFATDDAAAFDAPEVDEAETEAAAEAEADDGMPAAETEMPAVAADSPDDATTQSEPVAAEMTSFEATEDANAPVAAADLPDPDWRGEDDADAAESLGHSDEASASNDAPFAPEAEAFEPAAEPQDSVEDRDEPLATVEAGADSFDLDDDEVSAGEDEAEPAPAAAAEVDDEDEMAARLARIRAAMAAPEASQPAPKADPRVISLPLSAAAGVAVPIPGASGDAAPEPSDDMLDADDLDDLQRLDGIAPPTEPSAAEAREDDYARFDAELDPAPRPVSRPPMSAEERALRHRVVSRDPFADDADGRRIVRATDAQFADDEASRRRSAIAHLRAAVAATKADKILRRVVGPAESDSGEEARYRDDLARVVRPRPTSEPQHYEERDDEDKAEIRTRPLSEPLVLVSSLRVDYEETVEDDDEDDGDHAADPAARSRGFAEFAQKVGAQGLTELLEAAAAYSAFVEGEPTFSRPQIMRQVAAIDPSVELSREAGLRSFGQLLRQGRIQKLQRGQFMITEDTRFHPENNRFAGE